MSIALKRGHFGGNFIGKDMKYLNNSKLWKLLHVLMLLLTLSPISAVLAEGRVVEQDAQKIWESNQEMVKKTIMDKYLELQNITIGEEQADLVERFQSKARLRVFVSSSMGRNLLRHYVKEAKKYGATLVFRGLPNGSWLELASLVTAITNSNESEIEMQIDDEIFERFNIKEVPAVVLSLGSKFDKVSGNIGIRAALELMKKEGELKQGALALLNQDKL